MPILLPPSQTPSKVRTRTQTLGTDNWNRHLEQTLGTDAWNSNLEQRKSLGVWKEEDQVGRRSRAKEGYIHICVLYWKAKMF